MAFEPKFEKIVSSFRKKLGTTQAVIECRLPVTEGTAKAILCANAKAYIEGSEILGNEISFKGFANLQVIYLDEDKNPQSIEYLAEFKDRYLPDALIGNMEPIITANVIDTKTMSDETSVKVTVIVEICVDGIFSDSTNALVAVGGGNAFVKNEVVNYLSLDDVVKEKFELMQDVEIKDTISKVLSVCSSIYIESITPYERFLNLKGGVNLDIAYVTEGEQSHIRTYEYNFDFNQEIAGENINPNSSVQSLIQLLYNEIKITTAIDVDKAVVSCVIPVMYKGFVFNAREMEVVTDVFSTSHYINSNYTSFEVGKNIPAMDFVEKISGSATLEENMPFMDEVLGNCCSAVTIANARIEDGRLWVEGVAYTTVIYLNKEDNTTVSYEVEIPFSTPLNVGEISDDYMVHIMASIGDVLVKGKRGKEIEINGKLFIYADFYGKGTDCVIDMVEEKEEKPYDDLVLSVYIVKDGDTIWDIAKEMNVSPEIILEQNPELELPLVAGTRVVVYKQRLIEF